MAKFADYDSLLSSYEQLEKKFTQKCQQLAQRGTSDTVDPTQPVEPPQYDAQQFYTDYPEARQYESAISETVSDPNSSAQQYMHSYIACLENSVINTADTIEQQCTDTVALPTVQVQPLPTTIAGNNGNMSLVVPSRPKTISEASLMAKKIFD